MNADIEDVRRVLPRAILNELENAAQCLLPEGASEGAGIDDLPKILRASMLAVEEGALGEPVLWTGGTGNLLSGEWTRIRQATREVVATWASFCRGVEHDFTKETGMRVWIEGEEQHRAVSVVWWRENAEAADRVLAWLDTLDREAVTA